MKSPQQTHFINTSKSPEQLACGFKRLLIYAGGPLRRENNSDSLWFQLVIKRKSSCSTKTLNSNSYALDNENKLAALCKAKMLQAKQDCRMCWIQNTKTVCLSFSLWCTLCSGLGSGMPSPLAPGEERLTGRGMCVSWGEEEVEEEEEEGSTGQAPWHFPFLFINRQFKWVWGGNMSQTRSLPCFISRFVTVQQ